jgi:single-stranded DNA-binding protein
MIGALISGRLKGTIELRTGASGKPFTLAKLIAHDGESNYLVSVIAFDSATQETLAALAEGDSVALTGPLKVTTYVAKDGSTKASLSLTATGALTAYALTKKRDRLAAASGPKKYRNEPMDDSFNVDLPWGPR